MGPPPHSEGLLAKEALPRRGQGPGVSLGLGGGRRASSAQLWKGPHWAASGSSSGKLAPASPPRPPPLRRTLSALEAQRAPGSQEGIPRSQLSPSAPGDSCLELQVEGDAGRITKPLYVCTGN